MINGIIYLHFRVVHYYNTIVLNFDILFIFCIIAGLIISDSFVVCVGELFVVNSSGISVYKIILAGYGGSQLSIREDEAEDHQGLEANPGYKMSSRTAWVTE